MFQKKWVLGIHLNRSLGRHKIEIMPRRIDRIPNAHKLEVWRKEAPQIFLVLEFVFVKSIALLAGRILRESVSTEYPVRPEALNDRSHDGIDFFFGKMFD